MGIDGLLKPLMNLKRDIELVEAKEFAKKLDETRKHRKRWEEAKKKLRFIETKPIDFKIIACGDNEESASPIHDLFLDEKPKQKPKITYDYSSSGCVMKGIWKPGKYVRNNNVKHGGCLYVAIDNIDDDIPPHKNDKWSQIYP